jgi:hypothetical protein
MRAKGYTVLTGPAGIIEAETFSCGHCQRIVTIKPRCDPADMGGRCYVCDSLICEGCVGKGCSPVEKRLEAAEASYHARRSYEACR